MTMVLVFPGSTELARSLHAAAGASAGPGRHASIDTCMCAYLATHLREHADAIIQAGRESLAQVNKLHAVARRAASDAGCSWQRLARCSER
jgi:hypothetical protein